MASARLTPNGVGAALAGDTNLRPIVQVVNLRCVNVDGRGTPRSDRWRGLVSDGAETCPAMFAGQLSDQARSGLVRRGSVVQLDEYVINMVGGRRRKGGGGGGRTRTPPPHAPSPAPIEHHPPHAQLDLDHAPRRRAMAFLFGALLGLVLGVGVVMAFARLENSCAEQRRELFILGATGSRCCCVTRLLYVCSLEEGMFGMRASGAATS